MRAHFAAAVALLATPALAADPSPVPALHGMTVQEAIDAPRIHMQWLPDTAYLEPYVLSPDTRKALKAEGYAFTDDAPWGIAEGIVAGAPRLAAQSGAKTAESLGLGTLKLPGAALFGAHDPRGPAGLAEGE